MASSFGKRLRRCCAQPLSQCLPSRNAASAPRVAPANTITLPHHGPYSAPASIEAQIPGNSSVTQMA